MAQVAFSALGFDPAPGDPAATQATARIIGLLAQEVNQAASTLSGAHGENWTGLHADAFRAHLRQDVQPLIQAAASSFTKAAAAFSMWAGLLDGFISDAQILERRAEAALEQIHASTLSLSTFSAAHGPGTAPLTTAEQGQQTRLNNALSAASTDLQSIRRQAEALNTRYLAAAARVADELDLAGNMAPHAPGFLASLVHDVAASWDDVRNSAGDWVRSHVALLQFISSVLNLIATVSALLALFPPLSGIFGGVALLAAGLATADDLLVATFAHGSWTTVGLDAVGTAAGYSSIKAGAELADIFNATGRTKQMWKVLNFGKKEVRVAPGLFRSIAHMTDPAWAMKGGDKEFIWRVVSVQSSLYGWTTTAIADTTIPGTIGTWYRDFLTGKQPWNQPAAG